MKPVCITGPKGHITASISLPLSKSICNRLLILQAIEPSIGITALSSADDTRLMQESLRSNEKTVDLKNAGTCVRFLTAYFAAAGKHKIITGSSRMKSRPIKPLVDALRAMGATISYLEKEGFLPVEIKQSKLYGGEVAIDSAQSSQFSSALLLISPLLQHGLILHLGEHIASYPYIQMTIGLLKQAGVNIVQQENTIIVTPGQKLKGSIIKPEADWSAASYWYEIAALSNSCELFLNGLAPESLQGDTIIHLWMKNHFGVETRFDSGGAWLTKNNETGIKNGAELDLLHNPDLAPAIAASACGIGIGVKLTGLQTLALKESDRLNALTKELSKTGAHIKISNNNQIEILPDADKVTHASLHMQSYSDHRMAMAFAPLSLCFDNIKLDDGLCVEKSYPEFWHHLQQAGFSITG